MDFIKMDISTLTRSVKGEGVRYLELFLREYTGIFKEQVNPSCPRCLKKYLERYKNHFIAMESKSQYRLHAKYESIPLEFGSPILVNNSNITDEYAQKLLLHKNGERYFAQIPPVQKLFTMQAAELKQAYKKATRAKKKDAGSPQAGTGDIPPHDSTE